LPRFVAMVWPPSWRFDSDRGEQLLNYVRPDAILCAAADANAVRAYAGSGVQVIVRGHEQWAGVDPASTVISSTLDVVDVAHRLHEEIAAHRSGDHSLPHWRSHLDVARPQVAGERPTARTLKTSTGVQSGTVRLAHIP
jgi:hypothetical protein